MYTYTIIPHAGTYKVIATTEHGERTLVASYPTERDAVARLKHLQEKAGVTPPKQRRPKDWSE
jgi:hypothetical protein